MFENETFQKESGRVIKSFTNFEQTEFILMFEDLSLRFIQKNKLVWTIEQSISKVDKVEVFDAAMPTTNEDSAAQTLSYVHKMGDKISIAEVPVRIIQRYVENAQFFVSSVMSMFNSENRKLASTQ